MVYEKELETVLKIAKEASEVIMRYHNSEFDVELKPDQTPVTIADKTANRIIVQALREVFPLDGIVSEEEETVESKERFWYIDPIDGTKGFIRRNGDFAIHFGLVESREPVFGLIYKPLTNEYYYGINGEGAFKVSGEKIEKLVIDKNAEGLKVIASYNALEKEFFLPIVEVLKPEKVLKSGSEGLRLMQIAENKADLRFTEKKGACKTWDLCAPHAIIRAAGGQVKYLNGNPVTYYGQRELEDQYLVARTEKQIEYAREKILKIVCS